MLSINAACILRQRRGKHEVAPESQARPEGHQAIGGKYGDALLYVRYRYDSERGVRLKTVELVVEEKPWRPRTRFREEDIVKVTVAYSEQALCASS